MPTSSATALPRSSTWLTRLSYLKSTADKGVEGNDVLAVKHYAEVRDGTEEERVGLDTEISAT
jgi:hypothetical protein